MRRRTKALVGVAAVAVVAFIFLAPVIYWYTAYSPLVGSPKPIYSEYRSLGCMVFGTGTTVLVGGYDMPRFQLNCYEPPMPQ